jgi:hypothetical protein
LIMDGEQPDLIVSNTDELQVVEGKRREATRYEAKVGTRLAPKWLTKLTNFQAITNIIVDRWKLDIAL